MRLESCCSIVAVLLLTLAACHGVEGGDSGGKVRVDTLANGALHVTNPRDGIWKASERWHIVRDLEIGAGAHSGPLLFSQIVAVGGAPNGDIVAADGSSSEVRMFDAHGKYVRTLGRSGSGPGEFKNVTGLTWDAAGRLWVADIGNARYALYDSAGTHLEDRPMRTPSALIPWLGGLGRDGFLYDAAARLEGDGRVAFRYYRKAANTGVIIDTLPPMLSPPRPTGQITTALFHLLPRLIFHFDPAGYLWFGVNDRYQFVQRSLRGDTLRIIDVDRPPAPVSEAEKDSIMREVLELPPGPDARPGRRDIPDVKPAFERIYTDDTGHVIVQPNGTGAEDGRIFDVFDSEGRYLGRMQSDVRFVLFPALPMFARGALYGVSTDSLGAETLVRARIQTGGR